MVNVIIITMKNTVQFGDSSHFGMEVKANGEKAGPYSVQLCDRFKSQTLRLEHPRKGVSLFQGSISSKKDIDFPFSVGTGAISISVMLSGHMEVFDSRRVPLPELSTKGPGDIIHTEDDCEGYGRIKGGVPLRGLSVILDDEALLEMTEGEDAYAPVVDALSRKKQNYLINRFPSSPLTQLATKQIMDCTYKGPCRRLFMESKALELIAATLNRFGQTWRPTDIPLSSGDVERLYESRRLLFENMEAPPTIREIARAVGINEFKLKKGFRKIFNCTPFQALRAHRMEQARNMLNGADMTVGEVASRVGYTNMSHFTTAFRNQFGVTPGSLLIHDRHHRLS